MLRSQASPIVVMLLTSVIVILGLGLISYVVSLISSQQARMNLQSFVYNIQTTTILYPEKVEVNGSIVDAYIGIINGRGVPIAYRIMAVTPGYEAVLITNASVLDPPEPVTAEDAPCSRVYVFENGFADIYGLSRGASGVRCTLYTVRVDPLTSAGRPVLLYLRLDTSSLASTPDRLYVILFVETAGSYYEVSRLTLKLS